MCWGASTSSVSRRRRTAGSSWSEREDRGGSGGTSLQLPGQARVEASKRFGLFLGRNAVIPREIRTREFVAGPRMVWALRDRPPKLIDGLLYPADQDQRRPQMHTRLDARGI